MRPCKDCKWIKLDNKYGYSLAKCTRPSLRKYNPVSGEMEIEDAFFCSSQRGGFSPDNGPTCDLEGKYFEPKPGGFLSRVLKFLRCV